MAEKRFLLPPCSKYDPESAQTWLEDMAREGWLLTDDSFFLGVAVFEKASPRVLRYRLEATKTEASLFNGADRPEEDELRSTEEFGWEYVTRWGQFYIYRCADPTAPELNTDPQVQAISIEALTKRIRNSLISSVLCAVLLCWLRTGFSVTLFCATLGTGIVVSGLALLVWGVGCQIRGTIRLSRLRKRLRQGEALCRRTDWRRGSALIQIGQVAKVLLPVAWIILLMFQFPVKVPLEQFPGSLPITGEDIIPGAQTDVGFLDSSLTTYEDILFPESYELRHYVDYPHEGSTRSASFYIHYHRAAAPFLARRITYEYEHYFDRDLFLQKQERNLVDLGPLDADYAVCVRRDYLTHLYLAKDNEAVYLRWWFYREPSMTERDVALAVLKLLE